MFPQFNVWNNPYPMSGYTGNSTTSSNTSDFYIMGNPMMSPMAVSPFGNSEFGSANTVYPGANGTNGVTGGFGGGNNASFNPGGFGSYPPHHHHPCHDEMNNNGINNCANTTPNPRVQADLIQLGQDLGNAGITPTQIQSYLSQNNLNTNPANLNNAIANLAANVNGSGQINADLNQLASDRQPTLANQNGQNSYGGLGGFAGVYLPYNAYNNANTGWTA